MRHTFTAPNGITYTIEQRFVQTGFGAWSKKVVWDLTSSVTGTRSYSEKGIAVALAERLDLPLAKATRAIDRLKNGWTETPKARTYESSVPAHRGLPTRPLVSA